MNAPRTLQRLGIAWQARALREQLLLLLALCALVWLAADAVWWRPGAADRARLVGEMDTLQSEHDALMRQADAAAQQSRSLAAQERALRERLLGAQQRREALRTAITPPGEMLQRLREASGQGSRVTLVALAAEPAEKVDLGGTGAVAPESRAMYRLPLQVTVQGDYAALRDYLDRLDREAPALRWRHLDLQSQEWPQLRLTLRAFTLAEQSHWGF